MAVCVCGGVNTLRNIRAHTRTHIHTRIYTHICSYTERYTLNCICVFVCWCSRKEERGGGMGERGATTSRSSASLSDRSAMQLVVSTVVVTTATTAATVRRIPHRRCRPSSARTPTDSIFARVSRATPQQTPDGTSFAALFRAPRDPMRGVFVRRLVPPVSPRIATTCVQSCD